MESANNKMKVEIWSDVMCPFCYIGKRKFETALSAFKNISNIEITWKSFQLAPGLKSDPGKNFYKAFSENSGMSIEQSKKACDEVTGIAKEVGLVYNFDKAISANTFNAHRFSHFAKNSGLQNEAEEALFRGYFTEGKNIDDVSTIVQLGTAIGLDSTETKRMFESNQYADEVSDDIFDAQQAGVRGVPFYFFNGKQAISGVRESEIFLQALESAYDEWRKDNRESFNELLEGQFCEPNGECK